MRSPPPPGLVSSPPSSRPNVLICDVRYPVLFEVLRGYPSNVLALSAALLAVESYALRLRLRLSSSGVVVPSSPPPPALAKHNSLEVDFDLRALARISKRLRALQAKATNGSDLSLLDEVRPT